MKLMSFAPIVVCALLLSVSGCNQGLAESKLVGKYEGKFAQDADQRKAMERLGQTQPPVKSSEKDLVQAKDAVVSLFSAAVKTSLELKSDRTFVVALHLSGLEDAGKIALTGTWKLEGKTIHLTPTDGKVIDAKPGAKAQVSSSRTVSEAKGKKADEDLFGPVSADGKTITILGGETESGEVGLSVKFTRI